jgi:hypothetical protein
MILPRGINATAGSLTHTHTQPLHGATVCECVCSALSFCLLCAKKQPLGFYFPLVATDLLLALVNGRRDPRPKQTS